MTQRISQEGLVRISENPLDCTANETLMMADELLHRRALEEQVKDFILSQPVIQGVNNGFKPNLHENKQ